MNESKISVRYAKAFFLAAKEGKTLDEVAKDVKLLKASLEVDGFRTFLESPVIKITDKRKLMNSVFGKNINKVTYAFFDLILTNKRENFLRDILRNFIDLYKEEKGIQQARLIVPSPISEDYHKKFITLLENTFKVTIELEEVIDEDIIGGFILNVDHQQYDASVKTQLNRIKKKLLNTSLVKN